MAFKLSMTVDLCIIYIYIYIYIYFGDLDPDERSQWVNKGKKSLSSHETTKQVTSMKLVTTVGNFVLDLDFENVYMASSACCINLDLSELH